MLISMSLKGDVYSEYSIGPNTDPWGMRDVLNVMRNHPPSNLTNCVRSDKYETIP